VAQSVRHLPIGMFGAVMALAGLGLAGRAAAPLFAGLVPAPAYFTEPWIALAVLALVALGAAYVAKLLRYPQAVRAEFADPAQMGFCATLPLALALAAAGIAPYAKPLAGALWWAGLALLLALQVRGFARLLEGGIALAQVNAGWLMLFAGGIVLPGAGIALGEEALSRFAFGVGAAAAPLATALVLYRAAFGPALPQALAPTWYILLVPPALGYAYGSAFYPELAALEVLFFLALVLAASLLFHSRRMHGWPFGAPWWAIAFPLDALADAALRYAAADPQPHRKALAGIALALAALAVALALVRTLAALARGTLLAPPPAPGAPAAHASQPA
jgi:tellurite resistance protein